MESRSSSKILSALSKVAATSAKYLSTYSEELYYKSLAMEKSDSQTLYLVALMILAGATVGFKVVENSVDASSPEMQSAGLADTALSIAEGVGLVGKYVASSLLGGTLGGLFGAGVATAVKDCQQVHLRVQGRCKKRG